MPSLEFRPCCPSPGWSTVLLRRGSGHHQPPQVMLPSCLLCHQVGYLVLYANHPKIQRIASLITDEPADGQVRQSGSSAPRDVGWGGGCLGPRLDSNVQHGSLRGLDPWEGRPEGWLSRDMEGAELYSPRASSSVLGNFSKAARLPMWHQGSPDGKAPASKPSYKGSGTAPARYHSCNTVGSGDSGLLPRLKDAGMHCVSNSQAMTLGAGVLRGGVVMTVEASRMD